MNVKIEGVAIILAQLRLFSERAVEPARGFEVRVFLL